VTRIGDTPAGKPRKTRETREPIPPVAPDIWAGRHASVRHFQPLFSYAHLPERLQQISALFGDLAQQLVTWLEDGQELAAALRKLLEAKDAAVRQAVLDDNRRERKMTELSS